MSGVARSGIKDKWLGGTGWSDCDDNGVIVTVIEFIQYDRLMSYTAIVLCLTRQSFDFLHGDRLISYTVID